MAKDFKMLSFNAVATSAECDIEVADCGFTGDLGKEFGIMNEDGTLARIAWHDGLHGEDEGIVAIDSVVLQPGRLSIVFDHTNSEWNSTIPYLGVDITYDDRDDRFSDLVETFKQIFSSIPERIEIKN